jgi:transposase
MCGIIQLKICLGDVGMKPITIEVRQIIMAANKRGERTKTIASWVGVTERSVQNIVRLHRETNSVDPKPFPGRKSVVIDEQLAEIRKTVEGQNDITLEEIIEKLDLPIRKSRLSKILIGMGFSFKKNSSSEGAAT